MSNDCDHNMRPYDAGDGKTHTICTKCGRTDSDV